MSVQQILSETLEELRQDDFNTFKMYLSENILDDCQPIPPARLEKASRAETARKMIDSFKEESAVEVTFKILKKMMLYGPIQKLGEKIEGVDEG